LQQLNLRLKLNGDSADETAREDAKQRVKQASERKVAATETIEEAWTRILSMKNSDADQAKLLEVKQAMASGKVGRNPADVKKRFSKAEALRLYKDLAESQREEKLAELVEKTPSNYRLINTEDSFAELLADLANEEIIAVDTETTGLDVYVDVIVGVSLTLPKADYHVYIPIRHKEGEQLDPDYVLAKLKPFMEDEGLGKVLHNAVFDIAMFRRHGVGFGGLAWDTQTAMHLLNENEMSYKLKDLAPKYLGVESDTFSVLFGKNARFDEISLDISLVYAAKDTHLTWELYRFQDSHMRQMTEMHTYYKELEVPLLNVIAKLESNGYILDLDFAKQYGEKLRQESDELQAYLLSELGKYHDGDAPLNLNSPAQLKPALSKAIGKKLPNLDAKRTLKPLKSEFEIVAKLLDYKRITKLSGTYIDKLPTKQNSATKRWHSRFNPMGTVTGRFSSGKDEADTSNQGFNVQNQPKEARKMFVAPPGKVIIGADFSAQEIRCVAYLSGEQVLIDAFEKGKDPYAWVASMYYKRPYHEVYKNPDGSDTPERKRFKTVVLAYIYGTSKWGLADQLGTTPDDAEKLMNDLSSELPRLAEWVKETQEYSVKHGYVWMDGKKRKRRLPDAMLKAKWGDRDTWGKVNRAKRQGPNARVQGSSSIQTKKTMIEADEMCAEKGNGWCLWGSVHDELLFEAPEDFTREDIEDVRRVMTESYKFGNVSNGTDIEIMTRWGEGVTVDAWFENKKGETK
jgi:DNA polymerase-1